MTEPGEVPERDRTVGRYPYRLEFGPDTETGRLTIKYLRDEQIDEVIADPTALRASARAKTVAA
ncbi:hypothetical protein OG948_36805 (plasmid) [Embleya sp. NBC_00888]|uniref:hypothetical protein n=1 Tax=Embleya sp. NBC_00888 TaxID=2975960 RepID=UPI002F90C9A7|nr:hypothetical protein OG948_36805 [Embleya sp. NBC_00888]